jgi:hypothetical protein
MGVFSIIRGMRLFQGPPLFQTKLGAADGVNHGQIMVIYLSEGQRLTFHHGQIRNLALVDLSWTIFNELLENLTG